ncbi:FliH/SctL family protein [Desulfogranum mediterraneum]|uniref:FliH/SctL family protein n=1 Tax=Desulfogranum mediterraneum TaxID=160661 RepID=UPI0004275B2A|nr:FliH/SctL family protein [Desulfogranum mediterraneum]
MNSSKVYKHDAAFMPTPLVQEEITLPPVREEEQEEKQEEEAVEEQAAAPPPSPEIDPPVEEAAPVIPEEEQEAIHQEELIDIAQIQEEAYNKGVHDTRAHYQEELLSGVEALAKGCRQLDELHRSLLEEHRVEIINTTISLCRKIIGQELETRRDIIANSLEVALEQAIASEEFIVSIHPDDLEIAQQASPDLISRVRGLKQLTIRPDQEIARGSCRLDSNTCSVDATLEMQLNNARIFLEEHTPPLEQPPEDREQAATDQL